jgi:hypothetical protein
LSLTHAVPSGVLRVNRVDESFGHGECILAGVVSLHANKRLLLECWIVVFPLMTQEASSTWHKMDVIAGDAEGDGNSHGDA